MHEVGAYEPGEGQRAVNDFLCGLGHVQKQIGDEGDGDLDAHRILAMSEEMPDFQRLLDPSEEQFDGPSALVKLGYLLRRRFKIIRQDA